MSTQTSAFGVPAPADPAAPESPPGSPAPPDWPAVPATPVAPPPPAPASTGPPLAPPSPPGAPASPLPLAPAGIPASPPVPASNGAPAWPAAASPAVPPVFGGSEKERSPPPAEQATRKSKGTMPRITGAHRVAVGWLTRLSGRGSDGRRDRAANTHRLSRLRRVSDAKGHVKARVSDKSSALNGPRLPSSRVRAFGRPPSSDRGVGLSRDGAHAHRRRKTASVLRENPERDALLGRHVHVQLQPRLLDGASGSAVDPVRQPIGQIRNATRLAHRCRPGTGALAVAVAPPVRRLGSFGEGLTECRPCGSRSNGRRRRRRTWLRVPLPRLLFCAQISARFPATTARDQDADHKEPPPNAQAHLVTLSAAPGAGQT